MNREERNFEKGKEELALIEVPVALLTNKPGKQSDKTREFHDVIVGEKGKAVPRLWIITSSDKFGPPVAFDNDLYLALMKLSVDTGFKNRRVGFTRYQLLQIMRLNNTGPNYERITEAFDRLTGVRIKADPMGWDAEKKQYYTMNIGIISDYKIYEERRGRKDDGQRAFPFSYFIWDEEFFRHLQDGYLKDLDLVFYFSLDAPTSRRLYRYLDKKRFQKSGFEIGLSQLAFEKLGMPRSLYPSQIKQKLAEHHQELIEKGFLTAVRYENMANGDEEKVVYEFAKRSPKILKQGEFGNGVPGKTSPDAQKLPLLRVLTQEWKIDQQIAEGLLKRNSEAYIEDRIDFIAQSQKKGLVRENPAGLLRRWLEHPEWNYPGWYESRDKREAKAQATARAQADKEAERDVEWQRWYAATPQERVAGMLEFWTAMYKTKHGKEPGIEECLAKEAEYIAGLPSHQEKQMLVFGCVKYPDQL